MENIMYSKILQNLVTLFNNECPVDIADPVELTIVETDNEYVIQWGGVLGFGKDEEKASKSVLKSIMELAYTYGDC